MATEQKRARVRQERILSAALRVFATKGYHGAAIDDIASESDTSKGGVYFHFPGKERLFLALLDQTAARLRSKIEEAIAAETDPVLKADAALLAVLRTFSSHRLLARLFMVETLGAGRKVHERMTAVRAEFSELIAFHLEQAIREGAILPVDTQIASQAWFGALYEIITHWLLGQRPGDLEEAYSELRPLLMRSVGAKVEETSGT